MDHELEHTYSNMYLGTEIRFDGIVRLVQHLANSFSHRGTTGRKPATARA